MNNQEITGNIPGVDDEIADLPKPDELEALKSRADLMGISYHPSIGLEKLREKVNAAIASEDKSAPLDTPDTSFVVPKDEPKQAYQAETLAESEPVKQAPVRYRSAKAHADAVSLPVEGETEAQKRVRLKRHANELIRVNVICNNPGKKEWSGEVIASGNSLVGTLKKFVQFNTEEGWHVPRILYNVLRDRQCQIFVNSKKKSGGQTTRESKLIKEFALEVLEPLTPEEIAELAARQAATHAID